MNQILKTLRLLSRPPAAVLALIRWLMRNSKNRKRFAIGTGVTLVIIGVAGEVFLEPRDLPWRPLDIDDRAGFSTDTKLAMIDMAPASWCERLIDRSTVLETTSLDAHDGDGGCGWSKAVHIQSSNGVTLTGRPPTAMQCTLAAGAHIWLTSADYRAREILGSGLSRVHHAGTYSCRRMYNRASGSMSQHAYANAWDIMGFELDDGRVVSVLKHWRAGGEMQTFLHAVRDDACKIFSIVLGPDYNAEHRDHLHVDMGLGLRCS